MTPGRILIVDDEDDIRAIAQLSLEPVGGWQVHAVASGIAAVAAIDADGPFDAVLLDVMMPEQDGPTTLARLRETEGGRDIPVIFLTAKVQPADRRALEEAGATGILS